MRFARLSMVCTLAFVCVSIGGCSGGSTTGTVNGTVTLDGEPLKEGLVQLIPTDGKSQTVTATIANGKFTASALPIQSMKVSFSAPKILSKKKMYDTPDSPSVDVIGELIPEKYNVKTSFKIDVKAGSQEEKYELTTK